MEALRVEADESSARAEELKATVKRIVVSCAQAGTQAESLQRKIQVLEEEAEESDRTIRELNEKYVPFLLSPRLPLLLSTIYYP